MEAVGELAKGSSMDKWHLKYGVGEDRKEGEGRGCRQLFQACCHAGMLRNGVGDGGDVGAQEFLGVNYYCTLVEGGAVHRIGETGDSYWSQVIGQMKTALY